VESNPGDAVEPQIVTYGNGDAMAVWSQHDGVRYSIWSSRYMASSGWGTAQRIETQNLGDAFSPQVAVDAAGNAFAVWQQSDGARFSIWSNHYTVGSGWGHAELIETAENGDASNPQIAINGAGNALAVWEQSDGSTSALWASRRRPCGAWDAPVMIESGGSAHVPQGRHRPRGQRLRSVGAAGYLPRRPAGLVEPLHRRPRLGHAPTRCRPSQLRTTAAVLTGI
jgi:uncharacterized protein YbdZ (MbtH family)